MKNKRFASLFLASMMALQLATPLSAYQLTETQSTAKETEEESSFHGMMRTDPDPTPDVPTLKETFDGTESDGSLDPEDYFKVVSATVDENRVYYLARQDGVVDPDADGTEAYTFQKWVDSADSADKEWVFAEVGTDDIVTNTSEATPLTSDSGITAVWETKKLSDTNITTQPSTKDYEVDDAFDATGLVLTFTYDNDTTDTVTYNEATKSDFEFTVNSGAINALTTDSTTVTITYKDEELSDTITIKVTAAPDPVITGITVKTKPTKTEYEVGDFFKPTGLVITPTYEGDATKTGDITYSDDDTKFSFTPSLDTPLATDHTSVTITYDGVTTTQKITVSPAPATSITTVAVNTTDSTHSTSYTVGDVFSLAGLVLDVTYNNGTTDKVTYNTNASSFSVTTAPDLSTTGTKTVTVNYTDSDNLSKEFTISITVAAAPIVKYTVSFFNETTDTTATTTQSVEEGTSATEPTQPTKTGYTFAGWYPLNGSTPFDFTSKINVDTNLYAKWTINDYKITFLDGVGGNTLETETIPYNETVPTTAVTEPTKDGYNFGGWKYQSGSTISDFTLGETGTKVTGDLTVYASWDVKGVSSISIKGESFAYTDGATLDPTDLVITATYEDGTTADKKYNATDFTLNPAAGTVLNTSHTSLTVTYGGKTDSKTLTVTYPEGTVTCTVTFDLDGGSIGDLTQLPSRVIKVGDPIDSYGTPTKEGHVFTGWYYMDSTNNQQKFEFKDTVNSVAGTPVSASISKIYATWASTTDVASFVIQGSPLADYTEGELFNPEKLSIDVTPMSGSSYGYPVIYGEDTADLFEFSPRLDVPLALSDSKVVITYGGVSVDFPITVTKKKFTVTFDSAYGYVNGSQNVPSVSVVDGAFDVKDPGTPTREGYDFLGWYYTPEGSAETLFSFEKTPITSDITIYAKWAESENPLVNVEFITNTHTVFIEGETFNPAGLVMRLTYEDGEVTELLYGTANAESFKFTPSLDTPLTIEDKKVVFTYADYDVEYTIPITVNEDDRWVSGIVRDYYEELVSGAIVSFRQNNVEVYSASTDGSGVYSVQNVEAGTYTVVTTFGNRTTTSILTLTGSSQTLNTIYLPQSQTSTSILATSLVPFVQVSNIDEVAAELSVGESIDTLIQIDLEITNNYPASDVEYMEAYKSTNEILGAFLDISLYKSLVFSAESNTGRMPVSQTATLMEIVLDLPTSLQGKGTYYVYRMHNGVMERLSATANDAGEKINLNSSKDQIVITTRNFSTYAIAYKEVADSDDDNYYDGYVGSDRYTITTNKIVNGVPTRDDIGGSIYLSTLYPIHNTKVSVTLTPYLGFVVDYITATDAYGNNVSVYSESDGVYTFNQGGSEVSLDVAFRNIPIPTSPDGYTGFYDVNEGDWYYLTVLTAANLELMVGKGYGIFEPNATTTRAEIVQVLYNLAGSPQVDTISTFSDVLGYEWYYHAVNWAQSIGLVEGYGDTTFRPNQAISREELSSMFYAYAQTDPSITPILWPFTVEYSDHDSISPWALESVRWGTNKGLFSGKTGNFFGPQDPATRAEVAHCLLAITDRAVL